MSYIATLVIVDRLSGVEGRSCYGIGYAAKKLCDWGLIARIGSGMLEGGTRGEIFGGIL